MKRAAVLLLVLIVGIVGASCSFEEKAEGSANKNNSPGYDWNHYDVMDKGPEKGGTLRLFSTTPDTLNPILTKNIYVQGFSSFVYESLVKLDKDQKPVPVLCEEWDVSDDGLIWTFQLRKDIFWHDGIPFTAGDAEFTLEMILKDGQDNIYKPTLQNIVSFAASGQSTVRVVLKKPNSFLAELMTFPVMPRHRFEAGSRSEFAENSAPVGTGPFKFAVYEKNKRISLTANENWWNSDGGRYTALSLPLISDIDIRIFESIKDEMGAFQSGDIDMASMGTVDYSRYSGRPDLLIKKYPGRNFEFIAFNMKNPVCAEKTVRQAIARAIDRYDIISSLLSGKALPSNLPVIPSSWICNPNLNDFDADADTAKEMLINDGWKEEKGVLYKRINGIKKPLILEMLVNEDNDTRAAIAERIGGQLKKAGIGLTVSELRWDEEMRRIDAGKFDLVLIGCRIPQIPDISFLYSFPYMEDYPGSNDAARNIAAYFNPELQELINRLFMERDSGRKRAIFSNMQAITVDDVPYIGLHIYNNAVVFSKSVRGDITPYIWDRFSSIAKWYIPAR